MADGKVTIDTQLNNKGFTTGLASMKKQTSGLAGSMQKLGKAMAAAFALSKIIQFGKECVELGSSVAEVQNVVDVAFGDMAEKIESFADTAIEAFGMSRLAAKKTASTYMAMAKGVGVADEAASDMAIALTGMTGDVASFYNISQDLAATKLKSVFTGETESLKDLGVVMTQANLEAYALSKGIKKDISAMTQAEMVALRYGFVMDSLALAHGDFARTSDSWANQTRILSMQWEELMSILGQALITVLSPLVKVLNQIVAKMIAFATVIKTTVEGLFGTQTQAQSVGASIKEAVENQEDLTEETGQTAKAQKSLLAGFDEINRLGSDDSGSESSGLGDFSFGLDQISPKKPEESIPLLGFLADLKKFFAPVKKVIMKLWEDISALGAPFSEWFNGPATEMVIQAMQTFSGALTGLFETIGMVFEDLWNLFIYPFVQTFAEDILPFLTELITQVLLLWDSLFFGIKTIFDEVWTEGIVPAVALLSEIWDGLWESISAAWEEWGAPIFEGIREAVDNTVGVISTLWKTTLKPIWDEFIAVVDELWDEHLKPFIDELLGFIGELIVAATDIYNEFILPIISWFVENLWPEISKVIKFIVGAIGGLIGVVLDLVRGIFSALRGLINFIAGVFTGDWERAWGGIKDFFRNIINALIGFTESFVNFFIRGINKIIGAVNSLNFDVPDWVPLIGGETWGFNIPTIKELKLPRLATGAVIPPNREFLAVLGDQRSGNNIEAPEALIRKIVREESGGMNTDLLMAILEAIKAGRVMTVDKRVFAKVTQQSLAETARTSGAAVIPV